MKKFLIISLFFTSINSFSQSNISDILDTFKLGSKYEKTNDLKERFTDNDLISCQYVGNETFKIGDVEITNINLMYYKNQLMVIEVNIGNPFNSDNFEDIEFTKVKENLNREIGITVTVKKNTNPEIINEVDWKKDNTNYNLKRLKYKSNDSDSILGLLLLRDIKLSENFMTNMKK